MTMAMSLLRACQYGGLLKGSPCSTHYMSMLEDVFKFVRTVHSSTAARAEPNKVAVPLGKATAVIDAQAPSWPMQPPQQTAVAKYRPWDHTRQLVRKASYPKRMGFLIETLEEEQVRRVQAERNFPDFKSGDILEVRMMVPENQRRQYLYKGVCVARYNKGLRSSFKLYNVYPDGGAVVQHLPLYMPDLLEIKVVGKVHAGSRMKKYHILENQSGSYTFQRQVKAVTASDTASS